VTESLFPSLYFLEPSSMATLWYYLPHLRKTCSNSRELLPLPRSFPFTTSRSTPGRYVLRPNTLPPASAVPPLGPLAPRSSPVSSPSRLTLPPSLLHFSDNTLSFNSSAFLTDVPRHSLVFGPLVQRPYCMFVEMHTIAEADFGGLILRPRRGIALRFSV